MVYICFFTIQIEAIQQSEDFSPTAQEEKNFAFDYFFEKTMNEQKKKTEEGEGEEGENESDGTEQFLSRKTRKQRQAENE